MRSSVEGQLFESRFFEGHLFERHCSDGPGVVRALH
jgi:hypothetical protein